MNLKKLMSKKNKVYSFYELPLGIKKAITNYGVWAIALGVGGWAEKPQVLRLRG